MSPPRTSRRRTVVLDTCGVKKLNRALASSAFCQLPAQPSDSPVLWSIRYRLLCWLLRLLVRCGLDELDLETAVLRHQLKVLRRGGGRARSTNADRAFLAAAARPLSRDLWGSETPITLVTCGFARAGRCQIMGIAFLLGLNEVPAAHPEPIRPESEGLKSCAGTAPHARGQGSSVSKATGSNGKHPLPRHPKGQRTSPSPATNAQVKPMITVSDPYTPLMCPG
jgi:hypothetical protein